MSDYRINGEFRTQKARGVMEVSRGRFHPTARTQGLVQAINVERIAVLPYGVPETFPTFARPCPETPRHGFVESRKVYNLEEALKVYMEAVAADPKAEMLCMPPLTGLASAIANDTGVTWGKGHDGATGGKGPLYDIPCNNKGFSTYMRSWHYWVQNDIPEGAYVELVEDKGKVYVVQVRGGPSVVGNNRRYVPHADYKITRIIQGDPEMQEDMLAWEKEIKDAPDGSVVWLPGSTLASHMAVHGIARGLAVVCDYQMPDKTELLQPADGAPKPLTDLEMMRLADWIRHFDKLDAATNATDIDAGNSSRYHGEHISLSVATLHAMMHWDGSEHLLKLRAHGIVTMAKFIAAACLGEARHFYSHGPGADRTVTPAIDWSKLGGIRPNKPNNSRALVFEKALSIPIKDLCPLVEGAVIDFGGRWGGKRARRGCRGGYGYGGPKWKRSARVGHSLLVALLAFLERPSLARWNDAVACYNLAVNTAHNGGKLLDKFCSFSHIELAAQNPQWGFCTPIAMEIIMGDVLEYTNPYPSHDTWITIGDWQYPERVLEAAISSYNYEARREGSDLHDCEIDCIEHFRLIEQIVLMRLNAEGTPRAPANCDADDFVYGRKPRHLGSYYRRPSWLAQGTLV